MLSTELPLWARQPAINLETAFRKANLANAHVLGVAPIYARTQTLERETSDWVKMRLSEYPPYQEGKLVIPPENQRELEQVGQICDLLGLRIADIHIADELPKGAALYIQRHDLLPPMLKPLSLKAKIGIGLNRGRANLRQIRRQVERFIKKAAVVISLGLLAVAAVTVLTAVAVGLMWVLAMALQALAAAASAILMAIGGILFIPLMAAMGGAQDPILIGLITEDGEIAEGQPALFCILTAWDHPVVESLPSPRK